MNSNNVNNKEEVKENKSIYIMYHNAWAAEIDGVFALAKDAKMFVEQQRAGIQDFLRSDKACVTIEESESGPVWLEDEDCTLFSVASNVPVYAPVACRAEVEGSEDMQLSDIQHVWVVWSEDDPCGHSVHLTEQAVKEYLESMEWLDKDGDIRSDIVVQYKRFDVIGSDSK